MSEPSNIEKSVELLKMIGCSYESVDDDVDIMFLQYDGELVFPAYSFNKTQLSGYEDLEPGICPNVYEEKKAHIAWMIHLWAMENISGYEKWFKETGMYVRDHKEWLNKIYHLHKESKT